MHTYYLAPFPSLSLCMHRYVDTSVFMEIYTASSSTKKLTLNMLARQEYGVSGILRGATDSFFGFLGFDAVCALAVDTKDPASSGTLDFSEVALWIHKYMYIRAYIYVYTYM